MMGQDVERMVAEVDAVRAAAQAAIISFSEETAYRLTCDPLETPVPASNPMSGVSSAMGAMSGDCGKMDTLNGDLYTGTTTFNNSLGSPWGEITNLQNVVAAANAYAGAHSPFNWVGEKAGMLAHLNMVMTAAVDAKWAIAVYHDYVQRGFDDKYNAKKPSVTFRETVDLVTNGNITQEFEENVRMPTPSIDPF